MSKTKAKWILTDYNNADSLTAEEIYYQNGVTIANKIDVIATEAGAIKQYVRVASDNHVVLANERTVETIACVAGDRVLCTAQNDDFENGIYIVVDSGLWTRATDSDSDEDIRGTIVYSQQGNLANKIYANNNTSAINVGVTAIAFSEVSGAGSTDFATLAPGIFVDVTADKVAFLDISDNITKSILSSTYAGYISGSGINNVAGQLTSSIAHLPDDPFSVSADSIAFKDATDSLTKKGSWSDIMTATAGTGITALNGVLSAATGGVVGYEYVGGVSSVFTATNQMLVLSPSDGIVQVPADLQEEVIYYLWNQDSTQISINRNTTGITFRSNDVRPLDSFPTYFKLEPYEWCTLVRTTVFNEVWVMRNGSIALNNMVTGAVDVAADSFTFLDSDGTTKLDAIADLSFAQAGNGLTATSGAIDLNLNELTAAVVDVGTDSIAIVDASDASSKKESIVDLVAAMAGTNLTAALGVLNVASAGTAVVEGFQNMTVNLDEIDVTKHIIEMSGSNTGGINTHYLPDGIGENEIYIAYNTAEYRNTIRRKTGDTNTYVQVPNRSFAAATSVPILKGEWVIFYKLPSTTTVVFQIVTLMDVNSLGAWSVDVTDDWLAFGEDDYGETYKTSIANLAIAQAGSGLTATSGVLSTDQIYANMFVNGNATDTTITTQNVWAQFTLFGTVGVDVGDLTPSITTDDIVIGTTAGYNISASISFSGGANDIVEIALYKNNGATLIDGCMVSRQLSAGGDVGAVTLTTASTLTATDSIEIWCRNTSGTSNILIVDCNFSISKV